MAKQDEPEFVWVMLNSQNIPIGVYDNEGFAVQAKKSREDEWKIRKYKKDP